MDIPAQESLELLNEASAGSQGYLTCDSRANSDYDETDAEGEPYTDHELDEAYQESALARSSEPTEQNPEEQDLNARVAAALAYPVNLVRSSGNSRPAGLHCRGQWWTQKLPIHVGELGVHLPPVQAKCLRLGVCVCGGFLFLCGS